MLKKAMSVKNEVKILFKNQKHFLKETQEILKIQKKIKFLHTRSVSLVFYTLNDK